MSPLTSEARSFSESWGMNQISMSFWQDAADTRWISVAEQLPDAAELKPLLSTEDQGMGGCDPSKFLTWNDLVGER